MDCLIHYVSIKPVPNSSRKSTFIFYIFVLHDSALTMEKSKSLKNLIVVGDRVLIKPKKIGNKSKGGLFLPPGYQEKDEIQTGFVVKCGPGYPIPYPAGESDEPWQGTEENVRYIPLQVKEGDLAIFLQKSATEIIFNEEKYFIVPQNSILLLERDESIFD